MEREYRFVYEKYAGDDTVPPDDRQLIDAARTACAGSFSPYSGFSVGAAARLRSGAVIAASNQESGVFPAGICAEHNLLTTWQANHAGDPIEALAIASVPGSEECYPCGICRQVLSDTEKRQGSPIRIIMAGDDSATVVTGAECLIPFTFKF